VSVANGLPGGSQSHNACANNENLRHSGRPGNKP
jgi:hypothetical protein